MRRVHRLAGVGLIVVAAGVLAGCTSGTQAVQNDMDLARVFSAPGARLNDFAWVADYVATAPEGALLHVVATLRSGRGTVLEWRRAGNTVICDTLAAQPGGVRRERKYTITGPGIADTLDSLRRWAACAPDYVDPTYCKSACPVFVNCVIVPGRIPAVVYVEGGLMETDGLLAQMCVWYERLSLNEPIYDGDLVMNLMVSGTFAHPSVMLVYCVLMFDQACEIGVGKYAPAATAPAISEP